MCPTNPLRFGPFELDLGEQALRRDGQVVPLKPKVFDLLVLLVRHPNRLLTKDELLARLWPNVSVVEANLTQSIYELRRALGGETRDTYVETVPRRGYRFTASISGEPDVTPPPGPAVRSVGVLPFAGVTGGGRDASLELGIAETLLTTLSRVSWLRVRPLRLSQGPTARPVDLPAVGRALGVDAVVDGAIQRAGDRLRVTVRVHHTDPDQLAWGQTFDKQIDDIFALQDAICAGVATALGRVNDAPAVEPLVARHTDDAHVHRCYLKCRYHWHKWTPAGWRRSIAWGERAVLLDPTHAPSYAWMAASYAALGLSGVMVPRDAFGQADSMVTRALALDPGLYEAHEFKGAIELFHAWNWREADRVLRQAVAIDPGQAGAHNLLALLAVVTGQTDVAVGEAARAVDLDPLSLIANTDLANVYYYSGQLDLAIEQFERALELDPWFAHARITLGYAQLLRQRFDEGLTNIETAVEHAGGPPETSADIAYAAALTGDTTRARAIYAAIREEATRRYVDPYGQALVELALGATDEARQSFERAYECRSRDLIYLRAEPLLHEVRADAWFVSLMRLVGV